MNHTKKMTIIFFVVFVILTLIAILLQTASIPLVGIILIPLYAMLTFGFGIVTLFYPIDPSVDPEIFSNVLIVSAVIAVLIWTLIGYVIGMVMDKKSK